jgi:imidazolonepropionase-like amidohydrolase
MGHSLMFRNVSTLTSDGSFDDPKDVAVVDGVIQRVGKNLVGDGFVEYDLDSLWLMPGIFDCHNHVSWSTLDEAERLRTPITQWCLETAKNLRTTLEAGVTFVRDAGGADPGMRASIDHKYVVGPRLQVSINMLSQTGGHGDLFLQGLGVPAALTPSWAGKAPDVIDGVDGMRRVVRELLRAGANWIKLCATGGTVSPHDDPEQAQFTPEEIETAVFEARRRRVPVMAHAYGGEGLSNAVRAGARSIEHGYNITEEQAAELADVECFLVPTLSIAHGVVRWAEERRVMSAYAGQKALERIKPFIGDAVAIARDAGVKIVTGTDYVHREQHGRNLEELSYLHDAGLSSQQALLAATRNGAELCGVADRYGKIEEGYEFDAIVIGQDPSDMGIFRDPESVHAVFKAGNCVKGAGLLEDRRG